MKLLTLNVPQIGIVRLTLAQKLIASYAAIAFFTLSAAAFSLLGVYSLNRMTKEIARNDIPIISSLLRMRNSLLAQESYAGKFSILRSSGFISLFRDREKEFLDLLKGLEQNQAKHDLMVLVPLYDDYRRSTEALFKGHTSPSKSHSAAVRVLDAVDALYAERLNSLDQRLQEADRKELRTFSWTLSLSFTGCLIAVLVATVFTYRTSMALRKLRLATHRIAEGDFEHDPKVDAGDEIGELARDFTQMATRLKVLEQMRLDASPLTRLPGNIAIEREIEKRLHAPGEFAICYADLDNFKAYNGRYGYLKGSEIIKMTGEIILEDTQKHGGADQFVGHIGGDDFVIIVSSDVAASLCNAIIQRFDARIRDHYDAADLANNGIKGTDRYGVPRFFPIMTISIAVIICGEGKCAGATDIARAAAEIMDVVKKKSGSGYFVTRGGT